MHSIIEIFNQYGYIVLFVALILELIAFPLPGETLMTYCGLLVNQQKLNWALSILIAAAGAIIGITISYFLGRLLGITFFKKYGRFFHLSPERLDKSSAWFNKYGNGLLVIAYFIPGIRHITGYFSGITKISYKEFALNAYIGAFLWTGTFISIGKVLGKKWKYYHGMITRYLIIGGLIIALILIITYVYRNFKKQIIEFVLLLLRNSIKTFHSFGEIKIVIAGVAVAFLFFFGLVIGIIKVYLSNEFSQFDIVIDFMVKSTFTKNSTYIMNLFSCLTSYKLLIPISMLMLIWIIFKGKDKFLEIRFIVFSFLGGEVLQFILINIFRRIGTGLNKYTFPSKETFIAVVVYGFMSFMIIRHANKPWIGTLSVVAALGICLVAGLSPLFFKIEYPSDVLAGYIFGGLWLSLNIILLEVYRVLLRMKQ